MNNNLYDTHVLESIGKNILEKKQTVSVAESVTSGFLQAAISTIPDASQFFQGGITAYNIAQKYRHLMVEPIHALATNCVSEQVAREMSLHVCKKFNSDWGLAITGYASPVPESNNELFAYYAISFRQNVLDTGLISPGGKESVEAQLYYANEILSRWSSLLNR